MILSGIFYTDREVIYFTSPFKKKGLDNPKHKAHKIEAPEAARYPPLMFHDKETIPNFLAASYLYLNYSASV
jgi:hypothetical protein